MRSLLFTSLVALALTTAFACTTTDEDTGATCAPVDASTTDGAGEDRPDPTPPGVGVTRTFPTAEHPAPTFEGCLFASPLHDVARDRVIVASADGTIAAIDPATGAITGALELPAETGETAFVTATPVIVGERLVVAFHTRPETADKGPNVTDPRIHQRVAVVSLPTLTLDPAFPVVELGATLPGNDGTDVAFRAGNALARAALVHGVPAGAVLGRVYVTFGNARDLQPWHGWAFEIDLDAWQAKGAADATRAVLVTTPETACGAPGSSGSRERICGGGLWSPAGPLLLPTPPGAGDGYEVILPSGNGQLDLNRKDYANSLLRVGPGLAFDAACDTVACAGQTTEPSEACLATCKNLYVPRLGPGQALPAPESGWCDGLSLYDCWAKYDFQGGSSPVLVTSPSGVSAIAYATKDGHVYLADRAQLGKQYDRLKLVEICGTPSDVCTMDWAGMIVTQPAVLRDGTVVVPTFMPDKTHSAGVFGLKVRDSESGPKLDVAWRFPADDAQACRRFRRHPSLPTTIDVEGGGQLALVVEVSNTGPGSLVLIDPANGGATESALAGHGLRFSRPLAVRDTLFVASCESDTGRGSLEGYRLGR